MWKNLFGCISFGCARMARLFKVNFDEEVWNRIFLKSWKIKLNFKTLKFTVLLSYFGIGLIIEWGWNSLNFIKKLKVVWAENTTPI